MVMVVLEVAAKFYTVLPAYLQPLDDTELFEEFYAAVYARAVYGRTAVVDQLVHR